MLFSNDHIKTQRRVAGNNTTPLTSHERTAFDMAKSILSIPSEFHNRTPVPAHALNGEVQHG